MGKGASKTGDKPMRGQGNAPPAPGIRTSTPRALAERLKNALPGRVDSVRVPRHHRRLHAAARCGVINHRFQRSGGGSVCSRCGLRREHKKEQE